jgi:hypothetical protein
MNLARRFNAGKMINLTIIVASRRLDPALSQLSLRDGGTGALKIPGIETPG